MTASRREIFRLPGAVRRDPAVEVWTSAHANELGALARRWFDVLRAQGDDVRELLHDGHPTVCVQNGAFAYVNAFTDHVNVGFFQGAALPDPAHLLEGTGKYMRHVTLRPDRDVDETALRALIDAAYAEIRGRLEAE